MTTDKPKLALVTGGVRRVGAHISACLADQGYALALHGHNDAEPDEFLNKTLDRQNSEWAGFVADFEQPEAASDLIRKVVEHFGRVPDLLVNNASIFEYDDAESLTATTLHRHVLVNMMAPTLLVTALQNILPTDQRAAVVNIVDQRVRNPNGDQLSYTLSKQALAESVRTLAIACAGKIRINGVAPGLTLPTAEYEADQMENLAKIMPLGRLSQPDDIAQAVLYFASAESVTGQILFVDGGAHMKSFDRDFVFLEN